MTNGRKLRPGKTTRGGRKQRNHLYEQSGPDPDDADLSIGWARNPDYVTIAVLAVNHDRSIPGARWWCAGDENAALVYDRPGTPLASGWVLAVRDLATAEMIVTAVNGQAPDG